jgi:thiamine kinase
MSVQPYLSAAKAALARMDPGLSDAIWVPLQGGRTNQLWHVGGFVVKLYDLAASSPLFPNDPQAESAALAAFAPLGLAPRLQAAGPDWLIYRHIPGDVWQGDPTPVARLLHRLHGTASPPAFRALPNGSAALRSHAARIGAGLSLPPLPPDPALPPATPCIVHGDAVAGNILNGPHGPVLIDWQCPGLGDPCDDLAAFLSPAMQWLYTRQTLSQDQATAFLAAYPDPQITTRYRTLAPLLHWRIAAHCAYRAAQGDADYATALALECAALPG